VSRVLRRRPTEPLVNEPLATEPVAGAALDIRGVDAWYGQGQVLFGVDVAVLDGEIAGIFGHNGAGKSTLFRTVSGLHRQSHYRAFLDGRAIHGLRPHQIARAGFCFVREGAKVFEGLTVQEHLLLGRRLATLAKRAPIELDAVYDIFPILAEFRRRPASQLSGGQRQLLALGTAFASNPRCLVLDEPSTGLSPQALEVLEGSLRRLADQRLPLLIAEQNPEWLSRLATRAYLLSLGRIEASGEPNEVLTGVGDGPRP
jgi:branched-chain amino acid transport system ATP-binding protein